MRSLGHVHLFSDLKIAKKDIFSRFCNLLISQFRLAKQSYFCSKTNIQRSTTPTHAFKLILAILKNLFQNLLLQNGKAFTTRFEVKASDADKPHLVFQI